MKFSCKVEVSSKTRYLQSRGIFKDEVSYMKFRYKDEISSKLRYLQS